MVFVFLLLLLLLFVEKDGVERVEWTARPQWGTKIEDESIFSWMKK